VQLATVSAKQFHSGYSTSPLAITMVRSRWIFAVASHSRMRHIETYKPPSDPLSLSQLTVHPVLLWTVEPQNSHRCLNIFCILSCNKSTFRRTRKKLLFCWFEKKGNVSSVSNYRPTSLSNNFLKLFSTCFTITAHIISNINGIPISMIF